MDIYYSGLTYPSLCRSRMLVFIRSAARFQSLSASWTGGKLPPPKIGLVPAERDVSDSLKGPCVAVRGAWGKEDCRASTVGRDWLVS
jgi:hypothetical protein